MRSFFVYSLILMVQSLTKSFPRLRGRLLVQYKLNPKGSPLRGAGEP